MPADRAGLRLLLRAWRSGQVVLGATAAAVGCWLVPPAAVQIPAADGASSVLWPLVPVLVAVTGPSFLATADRDLERGAALPQPAVRALGLAFFVALAAVAVVAGWRFDRAVLARNTLLLMGLAVGGTAWLPARAAWAPVTLVPVATWLLGTDPATRRLRDWAVLLAPATSRPAWTVAAVAAALGAAGYVARPRLDGVRWRCRR